MMPEERIKEKENLLKISWKKTLNSQSKIAVKYKTLHTNNSIFQSKGTVLLHNKSTPTLP